MARIAVIGDDGRFGLGNVVPAPRARSCSRRPRRRRPATPAPLGRGARSTPTARSRTRTARPRSGAAVFVGKGVAAKDLPPFDGRDAGARAALQLFGDFWAARARRRSRALARSAAASMWACTAPAARCSAPPPAGADLAIRVAAAATPWPSTRRGGGPRRGARQLAVLATAAEPPAAHRACPCPSTSRRRARRRRRRPATRARARGRSAAGRSPADGVRRRAPQRPAVAGVAAAAAAAPAPPPQRAAASATASASTRPSRTCAPSREGAAVLQLRGSTPPLASTFGLLAAVWAGAEYHEIVLDLAKGTCDCHKPEMLSPTRQRGGASRARRARRRKRRQRRGGKHEYHPGSRAPQARMHATSQPRPPRLCVTRAVPRAVIAVALQPQRGDGRGRVPHASASAS